MIDSHPTFNGSILSYAYPTTLIEYIPQIDFNNNFYFNNRILCSLLKSDFASFLPREAKYVTVDLCPISALPYIARDSAYLIPQREKEKKSPPSWFSYLSTGYAEARKLMYHAYYRDHRSPRDVETERQWNTRWFVKIAPYLLSSFLENPGRFAFQCTVNGGYTNLSMDYYEYVIPQNMSHSHDLEFYEQPYGYSANTLNVHMF